MAGQGQRGLQQRRGIQVVAHQRAEQAHFLLDQRRLLPMREHRVKVDDLWRLTLPIAHQLNRITLEQMHARHNRRYLKIFGRACQTVFEQGPDQRLTLDQAHLTAQARQHEAILAQACRGIQHSGAHALGDAHGLGNHLSTAAAIQPAMGRAALNEIHPHRSWRIRPQLLQL
ncbi:hypothetical protein D3C78_1191750 [compost metagenome]